MLGEPPDKGDSPFQSRVTRGTFQFQPTGREQPITPADRVLFRLTPDPDNPVHTGRNSSMSKRKHIDISEVGDVSVVRFTDAQILDEVDIQELGEELFALVEKENRASLLLNFTNVEFLSSAALGKLISLDKKVKAAGGKLKLSNIRPEIYEVFNITRLNKLFDIRNDESEALAAF